MLSPLLTLFLCVPLKNAALGFSFRRKILQMRVPGRGKLDDGVGYEEQLADALGRCVCLSVAILIGSIRSIWLIPLVRVDLIDLVGLVGSVSSIYVIDSMNLVGSVDLVDSIDLVDFIDLIDWIVIPLLSFICLFLLAKYILIGSISLVGSADMIHWFVC